ncbi:MAG: T9SS type A sorting domain-containing protein [Chitinophagaceae bacterium]|nr:T9SS type A sorting domain-containing protein [Chitinophagaceae bacterium]
MIGEKQMGGQDQDATKKVRQTRDGYFVLANSPWSTDGDVVGSHGRNDYWVVKIGPTFSLSLSSFTAKRNCEETELVWQTRSEISTAFFEIQRSNDGNNFETINTVNAAGGIAAVHTYQYNDNTPFEGKNYYRLKTVSTYGTFEYSDFKTVNFARKKSYLLPNPVVSVMTVIPKCNLRLVQLFSTDGKLVRNLPVAENDQYNISNLPPAKYFLRLVYDKGAEVLQLIKL